MFGVDLGSTWHRFGVATWGCRPGRGPGLTCWWSQSVLPIPARALAEVLTLGRAPDCDVPLELRGVSGRHAELSLAVVPGGGGAAGGAAGSAERRARAAACAMRKYMRHVPVSPCGVHVPLVARHRAGEHEGDYILRSAGGSPPGSGG